MTTAGIQKVCVVCGKNVSGQPRTKDAAGRYYCNPCWSLQTSATAGEGQRISASNPSGIDLHSDFAPHEQEDDTEAMASSTSGGKNLPEAGFISKLKQRWTPKEWSDNKLVAVILVSVLGMSAIIGTIVAIISAIGPIRFLCLLFGIPIFGIWFVRRIKSDGVRSQAIEQTSAIPSTARQIEITKECHHCGSEIQPHFKRCSRCGEWLGSTNSKASQWQPNESVGQPLSSGVRRTSTGTNWPRRIVVAIGCGIIAIFLGIVSNGIRNSQSSDGDSPTNSGTDVSQHVTMSPADEAASKLRDTLSTIATSAVIEIDKSREYSYTYDHEPKVTSVEQSNGKWIVKGVVQMHYSSGRSSVNLASIARENADKNGGLNDAAKSDAAAQVKLMEQAGMHYNPKTGAMEGSAANTQDDHSRSFTCVIRTSPDFIVENVSYDGDVLNDIPEGAHFPPNNTGEPLTDLQRTQITDIVNSFLTSQRDGTFEWLRQIDIGFQFSHLPTNLFPSHWEIMSISKHTFTGIDVFVYIERQNGLKPTVLCMNLSDVGLLNRGLLYTLSDSWWFSADDVKLDEVDQSKMRISVGLPPY